MINLAKQIEAKELAKIVIHATENVEKLRDLLFNDTLITENQKDCMANLYMEFAIKNVMKEKD